MKERILLESKAWTKEKLSLDAKYLQRLVESADPEILWIGSSDSLVPVREVTNCEPGEILVYRNMGPQVKPNDEGIRAIVSHAVEVGKIKMIIICGYAQDNCIQSVANEWKVPAPVDLWVKELRALYDAHKPEFEGLSDAKKQRKLAELNIKEQVLNLSNYETMQKAWENGNNIPILGWFYNMENGEIEEVFSIEKSMIPDHLNTNGKDGKH
ncbi:MAG TPA: carbonic anhydrase [Cyclobacteriaceae bacterium]|nr:carbonic anhydrase [Cyclobacteriaceae bacterium]